MNLQPDTLGANPEAEAAARKLNRAKNALWNSLLALQPGYEKDPHNLDALNALSHWLVRTPYGNVQLGQGIMLTGPVGTGKTALMSALSHAIVLGGGSSFLIVNAKQIEKEFNLSDDGSRDRSRIGGDHVIMRYVNVDHLCIDDIGIELDGVHYGRTANVVADIIALRYEKFVRGSSITHLITNASPEQMERRYDLRTLSRISQMCGEVHLGGPDRRRTAKLPRAQYILPDLFRQPHQEIMPTDEEVKAHFARIRNTVQEAANAIQADTVRERPRALASQEADLEHLRARMDGMNHFEVSALLERFVQDNPNPDAAAPFVQLMRLKLEELEPQEAER